VLEAINLKFDEAFNKHDATAVGALYIANAAQVTPVGTFSGREAIEGYVTDLFQRHDPSEVRGNQRRRYGSRHRMSRAD
jgi:ketosteroid isomerase-like protein